MAQKFIGVRGIDPALFDEVIRIVKRKNQGKRRAKYSFVAKEINELFRLYVKSDGDLVAHSRTDPKEKMLSEIDETVDKRGLGKDNAHIEAILDKHHIIDERSRDNYVGYADRRFTEMMRIEVWNGKRPKISDPVVEGYR